jgi:hypothetical protein
LNTVLLNIGFHHKVDVRIYIVLLNQNTAQKR